jgi:hypothetical protein
MTAKQSSIQQLFDTLRVEVYRELSDCGIQREFFSHGGTEEQLQLYCWSVAARRLDLNSPFVGISDRLLDSVHRASQRTGHPMVYLAAAARATQRVLAWHDLFDGRPAGDLPVRQPSEFEQVKLGRLFDAGA